MSNETSQATPAHGEPWKMTNDDVRSLNRARHDRDRDERIDVMFRTRWQEGFAAGLAEPYDGPVDLDSLFDDNTRAQLATYSQAAVEDDDREGLYTVIRRLMVQYAKACRASRPTDLRVDLFARWLTQHPDGVDALLAYADAADRSRPVAKPEHRDTLHDLLVMLGHDADDAASANGRIPGESEEPAPDLEVDPIVRPVDIDTHRFIVECAYQPSVDLVHIIFKSHNGTEMSACTFGPVATAELMAFLERVDRVRNSAGNGSADVLDRPLYGYQSGTASPGTAINEGDASDDDFEGEYVDDPDPHWARVGIDLDKSGNIAHIAGAAFGVAYLVDRMARDQRSREHEADDAATYNAWGERLNAARQHVDAIKAKLAATDDYFARALLTPEALAIRARAKAELESQRRAGLGRMTTHGEHNGSNS